MPGTYFTCASKVVTCKATGLATGLMVELATTPNGLTHGSLATTPDGLTHGSLATTPDGLTYGFLVPTPIPADRIIKIHLPNLQSQRQALQ
ncbi:hypothetical protein T484DRAFT_1845184, partial [Baffinella frigidus]